VDPGLAHRSGRLLRTIGMGIVAVEVGQETPNQDHAIGTCTDAVGQKTSSVGLKARWNVQATRARELHQQPGNCSHPAAGFRVQSEAHIPLANGHSHQVHPHECVHMTSTVLTAIGANFVRVGHYRGIAHPEATFETMPQMRFEGMSQSLPREPWDWSANTEVACCLSLCGQKDWES